MARVVVVGGGFAGMSAAARLAKLRHHVTLLEAKHTLGGELCGVSRDGLQWQTHRDAVTLPGVFRDLFRKSGRPMERSIEFAQIRGRQHLFADRRVLNLPMGNRGDQHDALLAAFGNDNWSPWIDSMAPLWDSLRRVTLDRGFTGKADFERAQWKVLRARRPLSKLVKQALPDDYLRKIVLDRARLAGQANSPGFLAVSHHVERNFGLWRFAGGRPALAAALTVRLGERKVDIHTDTSASGIAFCAGRARGVTTSTGTIPADIVVWCAPSQPAGLSPVRLLPLVPAARTYLQLDSSAPALADEVEIHTDPPMRMWNSSPGQWTVEHSPGLDPVPVLARCGLDLTGSITMRWEQSPSELVRQCHWGWQWQGWKSALARPGVNNPEGVYFVGAHAHPGSSLELIGMATAAIATTIGPAPR